MSCTAPAIFSRRQRLTRATRTTVLLDVATRFADLIDAIFGPGKRPGAPGHPEIELALVKLYRVTNNRLSEPRQVLRRSTWQGVMRGWGWLKAEYHQDRVPVRGTGHHRRSRRAGVYLNAGVTDLFLESGEEALLNAMQLQWRDMSSGKVFVTGVGSQYEGEAFGDPTSFLPTNVTARRVRQSGAYFGTGGCCRLPVNRASRIPSNVPCTTVY